MSLLVAASTARAAPPENDHYENPTVVEPLPFEDIVDTTETNVESEADNFCGDTFHTVWYELTVEESGVYLISADQSDFPAVIEGYAPQDFAPPFPLFCSGEPDDPILIYLEAGNVILFQAGSTSPEAAGNLRIRFELLPEFEAVLNIDPSGTVNSTTGVATITGTLECTQPGFGTISLQLKQKVEGGKESINADAFEEITCSKPFSIDLNPSEGFFKGGKVVLSGFYSVCGAIDCVNEEIEIQVIQLKGKKPT